jgi:dynein heavy chain
MQLGLRVKRDIATGHCKLNVDNATCLAIYRCQKLPRAVREWTTYKDLRKLIDNLIEMVPLLEQMGHKAMESRHWIDIQELTGYEFDSEGSNFTLGDVIESSPLKVKEEIEVSL